jgi:hypothetical protein
VKSTNYNCMKTDKCVDVLQQGNYVTCGWSSNLDQSTAYLDWNWFPSPVLFWENAGIPASSRPRQNFSYPRCVLYIINSVLADDDPRYYNYAMSWIIKIAVRTGIGYFYLLHSVLAGSGADSTSYVIATKDFFPGSISLGVKLATHPPSSDKVKYA